MMRTVALCTLTGFLIGLGYGFINASPHAHLGGVMTGAALAFALDGFIIGCLVAAADAIRKNWNKKTVVLPGPLEHGAYVPLPDQSTETAFMLRTIPLCAITGFLIGLGQGFFHAPPHVSREVAMVGFSVGMSIDGFIIGCLVAAVNKIRTKIVLPGSLKHGA